MQKNMIARFYFTAKRFFLVKRPVIFSLATLAVISCQLTNYQVANEKASEKNNNVVTGTRENVHGNRVGDEILFDGASNIVEIIQKNALYFDAGHDVIIIKGDGNIIKLYNINIVDLGTGNDTIVVVGNREKYVWSARNVILNKKDPVMDTIELKMPLFDALSYANDFERKAQANEELVTLSYFDEKVSPRHAYEVFVAGIREGRAIGRYLCRQV